MSFVVIWNVSFDYFEMCLYQKANMFFWKDTFPNFETHIRVSNRCILKRHISDTETQIWFLKHKFAFWDPKKGPSDERIILDVFRPSVLRSRWETSSKSSVRIKSKCILLIKIKSWVSVSQVQFTYSELSSSTVDCPQVQLMYLSSVYDRGDQSRSP